MTKLTKIKFRDQMKSNKSKLSNTVSMKRSKMNKSNLNLVEHDNYLLDSNINIETVTNKEQNVLHDRKKCFNDKVTKKHGKKKTMKKNVTAPVTELNSQTSEIVPELCNKKLNASILCTSSNKKSHEFSNSVENTILSNCTIRMSVESNKKSLTNVVQKYRTRLKNKQKNQEMIQTEPERRILEYYQKDHKTRETKNSTKASNTINTVVLGQDSLIPPEEKHTSRLVKMQNKRKVIEKNVNVNHAQLNVQSPRILRSSRKKNQVLEEGIFEISRKKTNNTKTVLTLQNNISTNCNRQHEEHTRYRDDSDEENQTETFNRNTTLEHRINKSEENSIKSSVLRNGNLINSSEQRVKTRSTINRRYHQETQNTPTLTSLTSSTSNRNTLKSVYIDNQTLNDENISEFMYENCGNKEKLNETKMSRVIPAENNSNIYSCNLRNDISSRDDVLKKDHSQDRSVINVSQRNLNNFVMNCPEREFLKLQNTESVTQGIPQTNLRHLVDSKLQNDRNISMEIEKEDTYESCKSVKIGNLKKSQSRKLKETETRESEYCIQINENIVIDKNCTDSKKLTVPLVRLEDLSLYERLQLMHTPHYIEKRTMNREENETHYHSTTEKINNKISITNTHLNNCTNQTTALSHSFEKQMESIHLDKKIDTNLKTIDFISLNQFSEQTLKSKETEKVLPKSSDSETLSLPKIKDCETTIGSTCSRVNDIQRVLNVSLKESHDYSILISDEQSNSTFVNHKSVVVKEHVNSEENSMTEIATAVQNIQLKSDKYGLYSKNENNKTETLENTTSKLQAGQLLENILNFFLKHKQDITNKRRKKSMYSNTEEKCGKRKCVAMCIKCKQIFNLLQQFSGKIDFVRDEPLSIECTLCDVQINSLSCFQQHIMKIHLQCEGNLPATKRSFAVEIINLDRELSNNESGSNNKKNNSNSNFIFECCCCLKSYKRMKNFKNHIEKVHYNFDNSILNTMFNKNKYKKTQLIEASETYSAYQNERVFNETYAFNKSPIVDITNTISEISKQLERCVIETRNQVDGYRINTKEINVKNDDNSIENVELERRISEVKHSMITQITRKTSTLENNVQSVNIEEENSNLNNVSNMSLIARSEFPNTSDNRDDTMHEKPKTLCRPSSYVCNICFNKFKGKHVFLLHMSKHSTNSNINNTDTAANEEQTIREIFGDNDIIKLEDNARLSNLYAKDSEDYRSNMLPYKDCNILNSITVNRHLVDSKCKILSSKLISKEISSDKHENSDRIVKEENITLETGVLDFNYMLYVNFTQKGGRGVKRQNSLKYNIHIRKKCKTDDTKRNNNFITDANMEEVIVYTPKEIRCNVCGKKFDSQRILREHMFFLHDSIFEGYELSSILLNHYYKMENMSLQDIDTYRRGCNVSPKKDLLELFMMKKKNIRDRRRINEMFRKCDTNKRNGKWRCNPCKENFALIRNYLRHKYYYHNDKSVVHVCDNCNKALTSVAMVNIHTCTNVTSWKCKRCNLNFINGISLTKHNMNKHLETIGPHICDLCKLSFLTKYMLERHKSVHSTICYYGNVNNVTDSSASVKDHFPRSLNKTNSSDIDLSEEKTLSLRDKRVFQTCLNKNPEDVNISLEPEANFTVISVLCDDEEVFKCNLCNVVCLTKIQMKFHLEKWHSIIVGVCQVCNDLYVSDELMKHLITHHIVLDDLDLKEDEDLRNDTARILGLKRLLSLYEYHRFDSIEENQRFNCHACSKEFSSIQFYRIHYLKFHDTICLLCNIEFEHSFQAFEHKIKIHISVKKYLWVVKQIISTILQFNNYGSTLEDVILRYSEVRIHDEK